MQYDLIALDLDGTALSSNNEVQNSTKDAVRWAQEQGVTVAISTGRICSEAEEFARQMNIRDMVAGGGSAVRFEGRLYRISMPWEAAVRAASIVERIGMSTMAYFGEDIYMIPYSDHVFREYKTNEGFLANKVVVDSVAEYIATERAAVDKLFTRSTNLILLQNARRQLEQIPGLHVMSSASDNLEVLSTAANKGVGIRQLCQKLGTTPERTIAIGDSENDLDMLKTVGMPVAMANADPRVKALAKYETADNNHGGVAQAIYSLLGKTEDCSRSQSMATACFQV